MVSFTPRPLYPHEKSPWYPLDRRLGGPQSRSGRGNEEKKIPAPTGNRTLESRSEFRPKHCFSERRTQKISQGLTPVRSCIKTRTPWSQIAIIAAIKSGGGGGGVSINVT
jgi:hypothetical protein